MLPGSESENSEDLYIAVYDYFSDFNDEHNQFLNVKKGTELEILDKSNRDLWLARIYRTDIKGFIPYNYVTHINSLEAQPYIIILKLFKLSSVSLSKITLLLSVGISRILNVLTPSEY